MLSKFLSLITGIKDYVWKIGLGVVYGLTSFKGLMLGLINIGQAIGSSLKVMWSGAILKWLLISTGMGLIVTTYQTTMYAVDTTLAETVGVGSSADPSFTVGWSSVKSKTISNASTNGTQQTTGADILAMMNTIFPFEEAVALMVALSGYAGTMCFIAFLRGVLPFW